MTKKLILQFKNEKNTTSSLSLDHVREPIDQDKIKAVMNVIAANKLFVDKDGKQKFLIPLAAKVVTTVAEEIFNVKK